MTTTPPVPKGSPERGGRLLIVDGDPAIRRSAARLLAAEGFDVLTAADGSAGLNLIASTSFDVVMLALALPGMDSMTVLERIRSDHPDVEVVIMAGPEEVRAAVTAVRAGAYGFVPKPLPEPEEVLLVLDHAMERQMLLSRAYELEQQLARQDSFEDLVGSSPVMRDVLSDVVGAASTTSNVLISGERGTGKELVARAIHQRSRRAGRPLIIVKCGAIPEAAVETELFGSVPAAFAGAVDRPGVFEEASLGTVFLDEVGELPRSVQATLAEALASSQVRRIGASLSTAVDVRVIAATNADLRARVREGRFREDLFARLSVIPIELPPLRERRDDAVLLAYHFLQRYAGRSGRPVQGISAEALRMIRKHDFPGNVRELETAIERAVAMARGDKITVGDLPFERSSEELGVAPSGVAPSGVDATLWEMPFNQAKGQVLDQFERDYVKVVLSRSLGNVSEAARQAGMDRSNFRRLLKKAFPKGKGGAL